MTERVELQVPQEIHSDIHNLSDQELSQHLKDYDTVRNVFLGIALAGISAIGSTAKIQETNFSIIPVYVWGSMAIALGFGMMEGAKAVAREGIMEAKVRGLKVVKGLFTRKLNLQDRAA